jgi:hypothetical protein
VLASRQSAKTTILTILPSFARRLDLKIWRERDNPSC